jgi:hypothetical protein
LARLISRISRRISGGTFGLPPAMSRLPSPEQAKTRTIPTDDRFRLHDHQALDYKR